MLWLSRGFLMHSPVQMKLAAEAAHGARGEQGKINLPLLDFIGNTVLHRRFNVLGF